MSKTKSTPSYISRGLRRWANRCRNRFEYYDNNLINTLVLLECMRDHGVKKLVFSSSATVYGPNKIMPLKEGMPIGATNPYGRTKLFIEEMLRDLYKADNTWSLALLRYFNPIGAHESGTIGENPKGIPNNLMPYITQVAIGKLEKLHVFGDDYNTPDGTGVRDYIHVMDLAEGHAKALDYLLTHEGCGEYNLGTGKGVSVLELRAAFEKASGVEIPYVIDPRRPGDLDEVYADPTKAKEIFGWEAKRNIEQMCEDSWRWQKNNPNGFDD